MILNEKYQGPLKFTQDTTMQGMVIGDVTVIAGVELTLQGMVSGNLTIEAGAIASVQGVVKGLIINEGGHVELYGVAGGVIDTGSTKTIIAENAVLKGL